MMPGFAVKAKWLTSLQLGVGGEVAELVGTARLGAQNGVH